VSYQTPLHRDDGQALDHQAPTASTNTHMPINLSMDRSKNQLMNTSIDQSIMQAGRQELMKNNNHSWPIQTKSNANNNIY